jgi:hypothetical protein
MNTEQLQMPRRRKYMSATLLGAAAIAFAIGGLTPPVVSQAEAVWDVGAYDSCVKAAKKRFDASGDVQRYSDEIIFCCQSSGGQWTWSQGCTAPPATAQTWPQNRWEVGQAPAGTATQAPTAPQTPAGPPPVVGDLVLVPNG